MAPETGMVLLHKHGDDCMLVSDPLPCGNLTAGSPAPLQILRLTRAPWQSDVANHISKSSMKVARSLPERNGSFGAISASGNSRIQSVMERENMGHPPRCFLTEPEMLVVNPCPHIPSRYSSPSRTPLSVHSIPPPLSLLLTVINTQGDLTLWRF